MKLEISPPDGLRGAVKAPPSKSYTHRAIILAGLSSGSVRIRNPLLSADPLSSIEAMRAAGADIGVGKDSLRVLGNGGDITPPKLVDVGNSGTTLRIMTSVFSLCDKRVTLTGDESIRKRPMGPLLDALEAAGVMTESVDGRPPVSVTGPISADVIRIRGDISSQYISGLLIATPLRERDTTIEVTTELRSRPYLRLTLEALNDFGAMMRNLDYKRFVVPGGQGYRTREYNVEGDYSGAAFILGASAITGSYVTVKNLFEESKQGDKHFLSILKMMGVKVRTSKDSATVVGCRSLRAVNLDLSDTPDLLPITAVMCALAKGRSTICNVEHARMKECDRISAMAQGLKAMGAKVEERQDGLVIDGGRLKGASIDGFGDHRIVMAFAVAGLRADGRTEVSGAESIKVSYPSFIEDMNSLGADISLK